MTQHEDIRKQCENCKAWVGCGIGHDPSCTHRRDDTDDVRQRIDEAIRLLDGASVAVTGYTQDK